ncbi:MAG TPA: hypothetical protein VLX28_19920 [Thermoanaerobaculia bacterium]|nr:hypothetical protein [Thermoanaerobaculia bacterium]
MKASKLLIPAAALLLVLLASKPAGADCFSGQLSPDANVCRDFLYSTTTICASGNSYQPRFKIFWTAGGQPYTTILNTTQTSFSQRYDTTSNPTYFPGFFQLCIHNLDTVNWNNFQICIGPC